MGSRILVTGWEYPGRGRWSMHTRLRSLRQDVDVRKPCCTWTFVQALYPQGNLLNNAIHALRMIA